MDFFYWLRFGYRVLALALVASTSCRVCRAVEEIREIARLYTLSDAQLRAQLPVDLTGVVTFASPNYAGIYFQDSTAGAYVQVPKSDGGIEVGELVRVTGHIDPGEYAPRVIASSLMPLGRAALPAPKTVGYEELMSGRQTSQWVEVTGMVRSVTVSTPPGLYPDSIVQPKRVFTVPEFQRLDPMAGMFLDIVMGGGGRLSAYVSPPLPANLMSLVGATARLRGVCTCRFNDKRQFRAPRLNMPGFAGVEIVEPAPKTVPERTVADLLRYASKASAGTRVKVRATATASPSPDVLFVEDGGEGMEVRLVGIDGPVHRGDVVDLLGFAALGEFRPVMEDAICYRTGRTAVPQVTRIAAAAALNGTWNASCYDASLVCLRAYLLHRVSDQLEQQLVLRDGNVVFHVYLPQAAASTSGFAALRDGSLLEVTGVCVVQKDDRWNPSVAAPAKGFHLQLDSAADVVVLKQPAFWSLSRLLLVTAILAVACVLALAWAAILRRSVRAQTQIIKDKVQREAVVDERTRIAREFHDTVEQDLVAISIQLDAIEDCLTDAPTRARSLLTAARYMSRRSFAEVRRSVWDLRSLLLEQHLLPDALREALQPLAKGARPRIAVEVEGEVRRLPARVETHLLRIGQEAATNALKHANAKTVRVVCRYERCGFLLRIVDDGGGFDDCMAASVASGHFGLLDMRERAEKIGADFVLTSRPGHGTEITVAREEGTRADSPIHEKRSQDHAARSG